MQNKRKSDAEHCYRSDCDEENLLHWVRSQRARFSLNIPMSLSPRPEILTITISDFFIFGALLMTSATACADSRAGIMPSVRANTTVASSASASEAGTYTARPVSLSMACSGPIEG